MDRPLGCLRGDLRLECLGRGALKNAAHHVLSEFLRNGELPQGAAQGAQARSDLRVAKETPEAVDVRREDVLADVGGEMVVADELGNSGEGFTGRNNEGLAQVMDDPERHTPVLPHTPQHLPDFLRAFGGDFPAFEHLFAERIETHKEHPTSLFARAIDVEDVPTSLRHVGTQQTHALLVDDLDVRHELLGLVRNCACGELDAVLARELCLDLADLTTLKEPGKSHADDDVVGDVCASRDEAVKLPGASWREPRVYRAVSLPLEGEELPMGDG